MGPVILNEFNTPDLQHCINPNVALVGFKQWSYLDQLFKMLILHYSNRFLFYLLVNSKVSNTSSFWRTCPPLGTKNDCPPRKPKNAQMFSISQNFAMQSHIFKTEFAKSIAEGKWEKITF